MVYLLESVADRMAVDACDPFEVDVVDRLAVFEAVDQVQRRAADKGGYPLAVAEMHAEISAAGLGIRDAWLRALEAGEPCWSQDIAYRDDQLDGVYHANVFALPGDWLAVDFGQPRPLRGVRCDHRGAPGEYPRGLRVEVCDDGRGWQPVAELGESAVRAALVDGVLTVPFAATARHLRLVQLGRTSEARWSIYDLSVL